MDDPQTKGTLSLRERDRERELGLYQPTNFPEEPNKYVLSLMSCE
jgi:hypothetical protein